VSPTAPISAPDQAARDAVLDVQRSFIVQAPAGSGKTSLLVQRYLALLAVAAEPEQILAITFTRKAAGEMRDRILKALRDAAGVAPSPPGSIFETTTRRLAERALARAAERNWQIIDHPSRLAIMTIDAFNLSLVRRLPLLSHFGAEPKIAERPALLYREAARRTLTGDGLDDPTYQAVGAVLDHLAGRYPEAETLIAEMLGARQQWLGLLKLGGDDRQPLEAALRRAIESPLAALRRNLAPFAARLVPLAAHAASRVEAGNQPDLALLAGVPDLPPPAANALKQWLGFAELLSTKAGPLRRTVNRSLGFLPKDPLKGDFIALLGELQGNETIGQELRLVRELPDAAYNEDEWRVLEALLATLKVALANLQLVLTERGEIDYPAVAQGALDALGASDAPSEIALALDRRIEHILVDEFQDTSKSQLELLSALTCGWQPDDGRTLFLVGDPMQSIYRFRQAEVGLFLDIAARGLHDLPIKPVSLYANFRSQAGIVEWVNAVFGRMFPDTADPAAGQVAYANSTATHLPATPAVCIHAFADHDKTSGAVREARHVAALAAAALDGDPAAEVAILVRKRSELAAILPALRQHKLDFEAVEIASLARQPVVQDLLALTRALLHPADRAAWLALLRAPWCGLDLAALESIAEAAGNAPLATVLSTAGAALDPAARRRLERTAAVLVPALDGRRREPLRAAVERAWLRLGGPACVGEAHALKDAAAFFDLLDGHAPGADLDDPAAFVEHLADLYALPAAGSRLKVMTIHKAKGLEFDHVILPRLDAKPRRDSERLLYWSERPRVGGQIDLLLGPLAPHGAEDQRRQKWIAQIEAEKQRHETLRLLYVATTRAKRCLHLSAVLKPKHQAPSIDGGEESITPTPALPRKRGRVEEKSALHRERELEFNSPCDGSLLALLWPALDAAFISAAATALQDGAGAAQESAPSNAAFDYRLRSDWQPPAPAAAVSWRTPPAAVSTERIPYDWAGYTARAIGLLVHEYLKRIADEGLTAWPIERVESLAPVLERHFAARGLDRPDAAAAAEKVRTALRNTLSDPTGRRLLGPHPVAYAEYALSGHVDGRLESRIIDRLFIDDSGTRWIVDYKTALHEGGAVETFIAAEVKRYRAQLSDYAVWLNRLEPRPTRRGLYFPLLSRFVEIEPTAE